MRYIRMTDRMAKKGAYGSHHHVLTVAWLFITVCSNTLPKVTCKSWNNIARIYGDFYEDFSGSVIGLNAAGNSIAIQSFEQGSKLHGKTTVYNAHDNGTWSESYKLNYTLNSLTARFRLAYSGDGRRLAVGTHFNITLYDFNATDGNWIPMKGPLEFDNYSSTVMSIDLSFEGNFLAVSTYSYGKSTYAIFRENSTHGWEILGDVISSYGTDEPGIMSISGDGMKVAIGELFDRGVTRIFHYNESNFGWEQLGDTIFGKADGDFSGKAIALSRDGSTVAIGAPFHDEIQGDEIKLNVGSVLVYRLDFDSMIWKQVGELLTGKVAFSSFGNSIDISADGSILAVGNADSLQRDQYVRVFQYSKENATWVQLGDDIVSDDSLKSYFGISISLSDDGSILAVGSPGGTKPTAIDGNTFPVVNAGITFIYRYGSLQNGILVDSLVTSGTLEFGRNGWNMWPKLLLVTATLWFTFVVWL